MSKLKLSGIFRQSRSDHNKDPGAKRGLLASLSEPKMVTFLMAFTYLVVFASGILLITSGLSSDPGLYAPLAILSGGTLVLTGAVGSPTAWLGKHWVERGAAIGLAAGSFFVGLTIVTSYIEHPLPSPTPESVFNILWTAVVCVFGLIRFERCRLAPYALGKGPLLPEHKKLVAMNKMDLDWEAATNPEE